ncbi:MAG: hypothetical protein COT73_00445 [Bdellovibrio sp. CG10_big_fil_rev_8_21_14_0_10_47_8]|nr:MAG: hypothetical protein COT73_00445 [Bdellovibrio sp. CG10_big_fil_rev_8_21_14_0_10_47_8]
MEIFRPSFLSIDSQTIADELNRNGYFSFERAVTDEFVQAVEQSVAQNRTGLNSNWAHGVNMGRQYYLTHMLAVSKAFVDYVCHDKVLQISKCILGPKFRLKAMRYYETMGGHHMQWHTDNKTDKAIADIPGIIFIVYLNDVHDGEFQYIAGSHEFSGQKAYSDYSDEEIRENYQERVVSFKKPKGTIIIYNTYGIHRAKPVKDPNYLRKSLFFQVDNEVKNAEPILLNPSLLSNLTKEIEQYLGFGLPAEYEIFPNTDLRHHPLNATLLRSFFSWLTYRLARSFFDHLPLSLKNLVKSKRKNYGI